MPVLALGAVELVAFLVALAALLLLIAGRPIAQVFDRALGSIPYVGGFLGGRITPAISVTIQGIESVLDKVGQPIAHFVWMLATGVWHLLYRIIQNMYDAKATGLHGVSAAASAQAAAGAAAVQGQNAATTAQNNAEAYARGVAADAAAAAVKPLSDQIAGVNSALDATSAGLHADVNSLQAQVNAIPVTAIEQGLAQVQTQVSDVQSVANSLFGEAEAGISAVGSQLQADVQALTGDIAGVQGQLAPLLGALPLITSIPALSSALSGVITETETCLKPLCDTVTPNAPQLGKLGQFLQGLETLGIDLLVAGLFVEAVTNPKGLATEVKDVVETVGSPVVTGVRDLTGL